MRSGTVLLADSHWPLLEGVRSLLEERFEAVVMVTDEVSLVQAIEKLRPQMVLVDLSFPRVAKSHGNIVTLIREQSPNVTLILLSVHDEPATAEKMLEQGVTAFVLKGYLTTDLLPAIDEVRRGNTYISPAVKRHRSTSV
jgi:DNA-binding NarL/FixJ family response regulator